MTSGSEDTVTLQGPDEQYATWAEVEAHYGEEAVEPKKEAVTEQAEDNKKQEDKASKRASASANAISKELLDKLTFAPAAPSPEATPPLSPTSSGPQSSKTSPEVKAANLVEKSPVPPTLKPLLNPVVWYVHEKQAGQKDIFFLTNSADTQHLARDFQVPTKTIHQLRSAIGMETSTPALQQPPLVKSEDEPKTLFSYEDESEEEEVVFQPRGRGAPRPTSSGRGGPQGSMRSKNGVGRSPRPSFGSSTQAAQPAQSSKKPQIPIEEIDPDSFDRGGFGRGSVPLANTGSLGNHVPNHFNGVPRGPNRGGFAFGQPNRGMGYPRGAPRGVDRGSGRGRGRLFVP